MADYEITKMAKNTPDVYNINGHPGEELPPPPYSLPVPQASKVQLVDRSVIAGKFSRNRSSDYYDCALR
jgi:hypothetical protein